MKRIGWVWQAALLLAVTVSTLAPAPALAQDNRSDKQLREEIVAEINNRIEREMAELRADIEKMVTEILAKRQGREHGGRGHGERRIVGSLVAPDGGDWKEIVKNAPEGSVSFRVMGPDGKLIETGDGSDLSALLGDNEQLQKLLREGGMAKLLQGKPGSIQIQGGDGTAIARVIESGTTASSDGRGWLGVSISGGEGSGDGVMVSSIYDNSAAASAGLREGDQILSIDGKKTASVQQLVESIGSRKPGETIAVKVRRDGREATFYATLGTRPTEPALRELMGEIEEIAEDEVVAGEMIEEIEAEIADLAQEVDAIESEISQAPILEDVTNARPWLGITIQDMDAGKQGVEVIEVKPESPARAAGIAENDTIIGVDGVRVGDVDALANAIFSKGVGKNARFDIRRDGRTFSVDVSLVPEGQFEAEIAEAIEVPEAIEIEVEDSGAGERQPGFLGVQFAAHPDGVIINRVIEDTAASRAGLQEGDVLRSINNQAIGDMSAVPGIIGSFAAGDSVILRVLRDGNEKVIAATLGGRPANVGAAQPSSGTFRAEVAPPPQARRPLPPVERPTPKPAPAQAQEQERKPGFLGIEISELGDESRQILGLKEGLGIVISRVVEDSGAAKAGLKEYDVLVAINGKAVGSRDDLVEVIQGSSAGATLELSILRKGQGRTLRATLGER